MEIRIIYCYFIFRIKILISNIIVRSSCSRHIFAVIQIHILNISLANKHLFTILPHFQMPHIDKTIIKHVSKNRFFYIFPSELLRLYDVRCIVAKF